MQEPACNAYLDNAATTPVIDEAIEAMNDVLRHAWGNPSSSHRVGYAAKEVLEQSRATIAECLGVDADEIFFTSGATEANNLAVRGACMAQGRIAAHCDVFPRTRFCYKVGSWHAARGLGC